MQRGFVPATLSNSGQRVSSFVGKHTYIVILDELYGTENNLNFKKQ